MENQLFKLFCILTVASLLVIRFPILTTNAATVSKIDSEQTTADNPISTQIKEDLSQREYSASLQSKDYNGNDFTSPKWHFANRSNNIRSYIDNNGWEMMPRTFSTNDDIWSFKYQSTSIGRDNSQEYFQTQPFDSITSKDNQITSQISQNTTEWYKNTKQGIEHGFTIQTKHNGEGELKITGNLSTDLQIEPLNDGYSFKQDNQDIFTYANLKVTDANNNQIPARMEIVKTNTNSYKLNLIINDSNAIYPITIDPLANTPGWSAESNYAGANFGISVSSAGDVNNDGYDDVIVGAEFYDNGQTDEGKAFVWYGSASGLGDIGTPLNADWTAESNQAGGDLGWSVSSAGDVNGDGYDDVIIGAGGYDNGQSDEGAAFVWYGSASGLGDNGTPANADWTAESNQVLTCFGCSVSSAWDVNGDGYDDVIVGAHLYDNGQTNEGMAFVWYGSASGLGDNGTPVNADWTAESDQADSQFGYSVSGAGDVNGDTFDDVIVGAWWYDNGGTDEGRAFVYNGSALGLSASANWAYSPVESDTWFGISVSDAGDVNGDGYDDVIIGDEAQGGGCTGLCTAFVFYGSGTGLSASYNWISDECSSAELFGYSVSGAGDVNGDGYDDVLVGAYGYISGDSIIGKVYVYYGSALGPSLTSDWTAESDQADSQFGYSVSGAGDVNGDTYDDVIIGADKYDNGQTDEGRAFVYYGSGVAPVDSDPPTVSSFSPIDDAAGVSIGSNLVINFSEIVDAETGNINLYKTTGNVLVQAFNVTTDISGTGTAQITINPTSDLDYETEYYVLIDATAFDDVSSNSYTGIAVSTTWNFTTENTPSCSTVANASTYNAYPTCGPATCNSGYVVNNGACVLAGGNGIPEAFEPPKVPQGGFSFSINNGSSSTHSRIVDLIFNVSSKIKKIMISMSGDFKDSSLEDYTPTKQVDLCSRFGGLIKDTTCPLGEYTMYVRFFTIWARGSDTISQKIKLIGSNVNQQQLSYSSVSAVFTRGMSYGMKSNDVRRLQQLLATKPDIYPEGKITGFFGLLTQKAVQTFQLKYNLVNSKSDPGYGFVGPKTRAKLQEVFGK